MTPLTGIALFLAGAIIGGKITARALHIADVIMFEKCNFSYDDYANAKITREDGEMFVKMFFNMK